MDQRSGPKLDCLMYRHLQAEQCRACVQTDCQFKNLTIEAWEKYKIHVINERERRELMEDYTSDD